MITQAEGKLNSGYRNIAALISTAASVVLAMIAGDFRLVRVRSGSMQPTVCSGDLLLFSGATLGRRFRRGDVVLATTAGGEKIVKRLLGVGGDSIQVKNQEIAAINGIAPVEGYACFKAGPRASSITSFVQDGATRLSDEEVYLVSDNREESLDSRAFGPVPTKSVSGRMQITLSAISPWRCKCN